MRKKAVPFTTIVILLFFNCLNFGQEIVIPPFAQNSIFLDDFINGDTTATGDRNFPDATYVLERNGLYFAANSVLNAGWTLKVKGAEGTGDVPVVYAYRNPNTNTYAAQIFNVQGDFWLQGVALVGFTEIDTGFTIPPRVINVSAAGPRVDIDDCVLSSATGAIFQTSSAASVVKITNTIFANAGNLWNNNIGNGRPIDIRNVSCDSLIIINCTMTDMTDRAIRHYASVAHIQNMIFDHNTVSNEMAMHGCLGLGFVGDYIQITNNLFVDNFILGNDSTDAVRLAEFGETGERGPSGAFKMTFVGSNPNDTLNPGQTTQWVIRNNYYSVSSQVQSFYDSHSAAGLGDLIPLTTEISNSLGSGAATAFIRDDAVILTNPTRSLVGMAQWYWLDPPAGPGKAKANTGFGEPQDFERLQVLEYLDKTQFDLTYPQTAAAFTGADLGRPAGDLNWWEGIVGIEQGNTLPLSFSLEQNFPNPFNPATKIVYNIPAETKVKIEIFDVLGRYISTVVNEIQPAGEYTVDFDASQLSSGMYIYQLTADNRILSKKMMLLK